MISISRGRIGRIVALPTAAALALAVGLGTPTAEASTSQICGNGGSGYCLNDWGGAGQPGDQVNMYYGGTRNDDFYVQEVNRCNGYYKVTSTCPFSHTAWDEDLYGDDIVEVVDTNNEGECVATMGGSFDPNYASLGSCANPVSGSGGANGVIDVLWPQSCGDFLLNRYWTDANEGDETFLASSGYVGGPAYFVSSGTCWGGFYLSGP
jgi:hypothetical protein